MTEITISLDEYHDLIEDSQKLAALQMAGVDNWDGYSHALEILKEMKESEED